MLQSPPTFTLISGNSRTKKKRVRCLFLETGRKGLRWLIQVKCKTGINIGAGRVRLKRGECGSVHLHFFSPVALLMNMFPVLQRCIIFRNIETKSIERLNGLIKVSSELETKTHEYKLNFTLLFIHTLKYMTRKRGIKEV